MERIIELEDVEAVAETERGLVCRIGAQRVEIPMVFIAPGSSVWECGDRGSLLIPLWLASEHGLVPGSSPAVPPVTRPLR
jgi:hypothetical protein